MPSVHTTMLVHPRALLALLTAPDSLKAATIDKTWKEQMHISERNMAKEEKNIFG